jgi:hypothetical protein
VAILYGKSLSLCVSAILAGKVKLDDVAVIVSSTRITSEADWFEVVLRYSNTYWAQYKPKQIAAVVATIKNREMLLQPRLTDDDFATDCSNGIWANSLKEAKAPYR